MLARVGISCHSSRGKQCSLEARLGCGGGSSQERGQDLRVMRDVRDLFSGEGSAQFLQRGDRPVHLRLALCHAAPIAGGRELFHLGEPLPW